MTSGPSQSPAITERPPPPVLRLPGVRAAYGREGQLSFYATLDRRPSMRWRVVFERCLRGERRRPARAWWRGTRLHFTADLASLLPYVRAIDRSVREANEILQASPPRPPRNRRLTS